MLMATLVRDTTEDDDGLNEGIRVLERMEPDIVPLDVKYSLVSIAISLRTLVNDTQYSNRVTEAYRQGQQNLLETLQDTLDRQQQFPWKLVLFIGALMGANIMNLVLKIMEYYK